MFGNTIEEIFDDFATREVGEQASIAAEFTRQLVQLRRSGVLNEEVSRTFIETLIEKVRTYISRMRRAAEILSSPDAPFDISNRIRNIESRLDGLELTTQ